jgi:nitrogen fixation protein FixH
MNGANGKSGEWEFTGWHMLFIMLAFFGVIIAVNVTMAVLAGRSWTGLVVKNSYVASQHFNEELLEARRQAARGWQSKLGYSDDRLQFSLATGAGEPVVIEDLKASIGRPASEAQDQTVALRHLGAGLYGGDVSLAPGIWLVKIAGGTGETAYRRDDRIEIAGGKAKAAGP